MRVADRERIEDGPAVRTREQTRRRGGRRRVEFGFGDLDRLEREMRAARKAERERKKRG